MSSHGYSASAYRVFLLNIVDASNIDLMPDDVRGAIDEAAENAGCCLTCDGGNFELAPPRAFAVLHRRGIEPPAVRGVCSTCARRFDRTELRLRAQAAPASLGAVMSVDTSIAGKKFGFLTVAYTVRNGRDVACRCICSRLIHVAAADLFCGVINSCGCKPTSQQFHEQRVELRAQLRREIVFASALMRK